jgi:hypothetical protein
VCSRQLPFGESAAEKVAALVRSACETTKQEVNLSVHQDGGRLRNGISEILETEAIITEIPIP